ncbi:MAG: hypothetical protein NZ853_08290 [Leptospiraceae bacterium]|nr:hypothetical protein [Leptospiraceae bacterium]MDW7976826.1 hypothetical protein [Leptospiraceae bacterium]
MKLSQSKSKIYGDHIHWFLYSHRIELTRNELIEIIKHIKQVGLFTYLQKERPVLKESLIHIIQKSVEPEFWDHFDSQLSKEKYIESFLEQCLIDIYSKLKNTK